MFAKNLKKKVVIMCTFSDLTPPKVLNSLKKADFCVDLHNEFNNGTIFLKKSLKNYALRK